MIAREALGGLRVRDLMVREPVTVPSMLAPLSPQIQMMSVFSSSPSSSMASMMSAAPAAKC